jgi:hypothetical protein
VATLSEATAAPVPVTIEGETYLFSPRTNEDYGILENWVKASIVKIARDSLDEDTPADVREFTLDRALVKAASTDWYSRDGLAIVNTGAGLDFRIWLSLRHKHPQMTLAKAKELLAANRAAILDAFNLTQPAAKKNEVMAVSPPSDSTGLVTSGS